MKYVDYQSEDYTDYQIEQQFKLRQKCYNEGYMARCVEDENNPFVNPYTVGSIEYDEWSAGHFDSYMGTGRE
jgi:hypothetical protein